MKKIYKIAKVEFKLGSYPSEFVAKYGIKKMFKRKLIIIPGLKMKFIYHISKLGPVKLKLKITYNIQRRKLEK